MKKIFFISVIFLSVNLNAQTNTWTFDSDNENWGVFNHPRAIEMTHEVSSELVESGHLKLTIPSGKKDGWLFAPQTEINADKYKYLHFSMTLEGADNLSNRGIIGLLTFGSEAGSILKGINYPKFSIKKGQNVYTINLSKNSNWKGTRYINRLHLPQDLTNQERLNFNPSTATFRLDWISLTEDPNPPTN